MSSTTNTVRTCRDTKCTTDHGPVKDRTVALCPHCHRDCGIPRATGGCYALDSGGDCPTCRRAVCQRCAGGWC